MPVLHTKCDIEVMSYTCFAAETFTFGFPSFFSLQIFACDYFFVIAVSFAVYYLLSTFCCFLCLQLCFHHSFALHQLCVLVQGAPNGMLEIVKLLNALFNMQMQQINFVAYINVGFCALFLYCRICGQHVMSVSTCFAAVNLMVLLQVCCAAVHNSL